jgi:hypothetical protein
LLALLQQEFCLLAIPQPQLHQIIRRGTQLVTNLFLDPSLLLQLFLFLDHCRGLLLNLVPILNLILLT